ncbi:serine hydrolase domain-containing protein [soil metagenome]
MSVPLHVGIDRLDGGERMRVERVIADAVPSVAPTLALMVRRSGEPVFEAATGWMDPDKRTRPAATDALFDLASLTKLFTATMFLGLVSEGRVALDDAVVGIIPELGGSGPRPVDGGQEPLTRRLLPTPPEHAGWLVDPVEVTFRQLLTHTSGLAPWRAIFEAAGPVPPPPDDPDPTLASARWAAGLAAVCGYPFVDVPGRAFHYSDLGFMLLGEAVQRLGGLTLDQAIAERVTRPLGLETVTFNPVQAGVARREVVPTSVDASWRGRRCWGEAEDENAAGLGGVSGHAGLFASAADVARFGQAWLDGDPRLGLTRRLLSEATTDQTAGVVERPGARGLGWQLRAEHLRDGEAAFLEPLTPGSYGHTGFTGTSLVIDPSRGLVVALLTNRVHAERTHPGIDELRAAVSRAVA